MATDARAYRVLVWKTAWPKAWANARSWGALVAIALGALALALPAIEAWRSTAAWAIPLGFLVMLLVIELLRAPYTLHSKLESEVMLLRARLSDRQRHQELADELTERYDWATHHLLNRVDRKKTPPVEWKVQVDAFRLEILEILKRHGCSRQEITHFEVINQFEMAQLDMPFSTAMFLIRVARMTDISSKHARIAESRLLRPD